MRPTVSSVWLCGSWAAARRRRGEGQQGRVGRNGVACPRVVLQQERDGWPRRLPPQEFAQRSQLACALTLRPSSCGLPSLFLLIYIFMRCHTTQRITACMQLYCE